MLPMIVSFTRSLGFPWIWTFPTRARGDPPVKEFLATPTASEAERPASTAETWAL